MIGRLSTRGPTNRVPSQSGQQTLSKFSFQATLGRLAKQNSIISIKKVSIAQVQKQKNSLIEQKFFGEDLPKLSTFLWCLYQPQ